MSKSPALEALINKQAECARRVGVLLHFIAKRVRPINLWLLYTKPLPFDKEFPNSDSAKANLASFHTAIDNGDFVEALKYRLPKPKAPRLMPQHGVILHMLIKQASTKLAVETMLEWIGMLQERVNTGSPQRVFDFLCQAGVDLPGSNKLGSIFPGNTWWEYPYGHNLDELQWLYNQAIWETLNNAPGMMDRVRSLLLADIRQPSHIFPGDGADEAFGDKLLKSYARELRGFVTTDPNPIWFTPIAA